MSPILVVFLTVVLDLVGFGIVIPLMTYYAESFQASPLQVTLLMSTYSLAQFFAAPLWGQVSDRVGRRPVLVGSIAMTAAMIAAFASSTSLWMLFLFRTLHGVATANISTAQACMADISKPEDRARAMGLIGAAFGIGFTIGPVIGGVLSGENGENLTTPLWFAAGLSAINFVLALIFLPETRKPGTRSEKRPISPLALLSALRHPAIGLCILLFFLSTFSFALMESTFTLFAEHRHGLSARDIGYVFGLIGVVGIVVQGGLIRPLIKRFGEKRLVSAGLLILAIGLALLPLLPFGNWLRLDCAVIAVGTGLATPSLNSLISRSAAADEQGMMLGSSQSMAALARATGPALGGYLFGSVGDYAPFWTAAGILVGAFFLSFPATARARLEAPRGDVTQR